MSSLHSPPPQPPCPRFIPFSVAGWRCFQPPSASPAHLLSVVPLLDELVYHLLYLSVTFHLQVFYQRIKSAWPIICFHYWLMGLHNSGNSWKGERERAGFQMFFPQTHSFLLSRTDLGSNSTLSGCFTSQMNKWSLLVSGIAKQICYLRTVLGKQQAFDKLYWQFLQEHLWKWASLSPLSFFS